VPRAGSACGYAADGVRSEGWQVALEGFAPPGAAFRMPRSLPHQSSFDQSRSDCDRGEGVDQQNGDVEYDIARIRADDERAAKRGGVYQWKKLSD
jgi:hypothetical protein